MKISIVTDEISADPETAIELGTDWGVHDFELRGYYADRAPLLSRYQRQRLRDTLERYNARIIGLSPGLFKFPLPPRQADWETLAWMDRANYERWEDSQNLVRSHLDELLPASIDYAHELGVNLLVSFGFSRGGALTAHRPTRRSK